MLPDCDPKYIIRYGYQIGVISTRSIYLEFHFITILFSHTQNIFRGVNVTQLYIQVSFETFELIYEFEACIKVLNIFQLYAS